MSIPAQAKALVKPSDFSEAGAALVFVERERHSILWTDSAGWFRWDKKKWARDEHGVMLAGMDYSKALLDDALEEYRKNLTTDPNTGKITVPGPVMEYLKFSQRCRSANAIQNIVKLSKSSVHIPAAKLDPDPFALNCEAGIIDLRTGTISPHDPARFCTMIAPFSPSSEGADIWENFLDLVTENDSDLKRYLQEVTGMCAIGKIFQEGIILEVGPGRNGKSSFNNAVSRVMGDYAGSIDSSVLTTDRQNRGPALATLRGKRLVTCGELEEGQRLSVQTLKRLASTDSLTIEEKYRQPETITPSHHIVLFSNFLPRVGSTDNGTWRRLNVIPFNAIMPSGNKDIPDYAAFLAEKAGGAILQWIVEGAVRFCQNSFHITIPEVVRQATSNYRKEEDWLSNFLAERCFTDDPNARIRGGELYSEYQDFARNTGEYCRRNNDFAKALEAAGFHKVTINGRAYWKGISIDYAQTYAPPSRAKYY